MKLIETILQKLGLLEDPKNLLGKRFNLKVNEKILQGTIYTDNNIDYEFLVEAKEGSIDSANLPLINPVYFRKGKSSFIFPKDKLLAFCRYVPTTPFFSKLYTFRKSFLDKALPN